MKGKRALALRYAKVLFEIGDERFLEVLRVLGTEREDNVRLFVHDPTLSPSKKAEIISETFGFDGKCGRFLEVLFSHKRFDILEEVAKIAEVLSMRADGKEKVVVESADDLTDDEKKIIFDTIKKVRKTEPVIELKTNSELLAGITMDFEDSVVDLSAAGALKRAATFMHGG